MATSVEPKITRKSTQRIVIGLFALAALLLGYQYLRNLGTDTRPIFGGGDSTGFVAAVLEKDDGGSQVVLIKEDGTIMESPGYVAGATDREPAWPSDGRFLYFISDRDQGQSHVFRWAFKDGVVERRSLDKRTKAMPWFPPDSYPDASKLGIVVSGGKVIQFDPQNSEAQQLLPPVAKEIGGGDEGSISQFDQTYSSLGTSVREAKWGKDKAWIAAVLRRENGGEVLVVQDSAGEKPPTPVVFGTRVEFDVNAAEGGLIYCVQGLEFPNPETVPKEFVKDGKIVKPFLHGVGFFSPDQEAVGYIATSKEDQIVFSSPRVSPDGSTLMMLVGELDGETFRSRSLVTLPAQVGGSEAVARLLDGDVTSPSWNGDGSKIVYIKLVEGKRAVHTINKDGGEERNLTGDKGDFVQPAFSPKTKSVQ